MQAHSSCKWCRSLDRVRLNQSGSLDSTTRGPWGMIKKACLPAHLGRNSLFTLTDIQVTKRLERWMKGACFCPLIWCSSSPLPESLAMDGLEKRFEGLVVVSRDREGSVCRADLCTQPALLSGPRNSLFKVTRRSSSEVSHHKATDAIVTKSNAYVP